MEWSNKLILILSSISLSFCSDVIIYKYIYVYIVRFKGENLSDIVSYIFVEGKNGNDDKDVYREKLSSFDKESKDPKFDEFFKQINAGYTPYQSS